MMQQGELARALTATSSEACTSEEAESTLEREPAEESIGEAGRVAEDARDDVGSEREWATLAAACTIHWSIVCA